VSVNSYIEFAFLDESLCLLSLSNKIGRDSDFHFSDVGSHIFFVGFFVSEWVKGKWGWGQGK
jgi:hypothetical protein